MPRRTRAADAYSDVLKSACWAPAKPSRNFCSSPRPAYSDDVPDMSAANDRAARDFGEVLFIAVLLLFIAVLS